MTRRAWTFRGGALGLGSATRVMGILNVTPDSFSDGGAWVGPDAALARAEALGAAGADLIDVGGESTRPGYTPVPAETEWDRIAPVLDRVRRRIALPISVDTQKAEVARRALSAGADIVNDVSGLADPAMANVVAKAGAGYVLMYNPPPLAEGAVQVDAIRRWLEERIARLAAAGVTRSQIVVDPGLGFAYGVEDNWRVLLQLERLTGVGEGLLIGPSRKRFLGSVTGRPAAERDVATAAVAALAVTKGVDVVRVHQVAMTRDAVRVADRWVGRGG